MVTEVRYDTSGGAVCVNSGACCHGVAGQIHQNIQVGFSDAPGGSEIVQLAYVGKAIGVGAERVCHRIEFSARAS